MKKFWLGFGIVALSGLTVYWTSFWHLFRGETYIYFLNTQGYNTFASLVSHFYNYEKTRIYEPGDTLLFRPLLFTIIGAEKAFFGTNYTLWHIFAVTLHLITSFCLFRLLWKWRKGWMAVIVSVLFATSYMIVNTVLYEQVVPYMAFTALLLTALYYIDDKPIASFASMVVGAFIYEMALPFVILMAVYYLYKKQRKWAIVILSVIPIYLAFYLPQKLINPSPLMSGDANGLFSFQGVISGLSSTLILAESWLADIVFPAAFSLKAIPQLIYSPAQIISVSFGVLLALNVIALFILADPVMDYLKRLQKKMIKGDPFIALVLGMIIATILSVALFRSGSHGTNYTINHSFGSYVVLALFLALGFALIKDKEFSQRQYTLSIIGLLVFVGLSAPKTFVLNYQVKQSDAQSQNMSIMTYSGSPDNPVWFQTTIPAIMAGVK